MPGVAKRLPLQRCSRQKIIFSFQGEESRARSATTFSPGVPTAGSNMITQAQITLVGQIRMGSAVSGGPSSGLPIDNDETDRFMITPTEGSSSTFDSLTGLTPPETPQE